MNTSAFVILIFLMLFNSVICSSTDQRYIIKYLPMYHETYAMAKLDTCKGQLTFLSGNQWKTGKSELSQGKPGTYDFQMVCTGPFDWTAVILTDSLVPA